jgi:hypothetical protein
MANDVLNSLNTQMIQAMDKAGITLDRLLGQLSDELQAKDTKFFADKGIIKDTAEVIAHDVRQRARIDAHKLRGDYPATGVNLQSTGEHTVVIRKFGDEPE